MSPHPDIVFALLALAFTPFAYWILGPLHGVREGGSSPLLRKALVLAWLLCIGLALYSTLIGL